MKQNNLPSFASSVFFLLLFLWVTVGVSAQSSEIEAARVIKVEGSAFVVDATSGERAALGIGDRIGPGATLVTEEKSRLVLLFSNGAAMTLGPLTSMNIEEYLHEGAGAKPTNPNPSTASLFLEYGEVLGNIEGLDSRSQFNVRTPLGTAGIRGTTFRISYTADGAIVIVSNIQGTVEWIVGNAPVIDVADGQNLTVTGSIGANGAVEIIETVFSGMDQAEVREVVRGLVEAISSRLNESLPQGNSVPGLLPHQHESHRISPSRP